MNFRLLSLIIFTILNIALNASTTTNYIRNNDIGVSIKVGTLGLGLDVYKEVYKKTNMRVNINSFFYNHSQEIEDINYDINLKLFTIGALLDYFIFDGVFRGTFGIYYNNNELSGKAIINDKGITIGDKTYNISDIGDLQLDINFEKINPYIGIGWGSSSKKSGLSFGFDIGALYHKNPIVTFTPNIENDNLKDEITKNSDKELIKLEDLLKTFNFYPVISFSLNYNF